MDELAMMKQQIDLVNKQNELLNKTVGIEFERISKAFSQLGNLLDLLYLETSVLIETLAEKGLISQEEFTKRLEETAKKVEQQINEAAEKREKEASPIIEKI